MTAQPFGKQEDVPLHTGAGQLIAPEQSSCGSGLEAWHDPSPLQVTVHDAAFLQVTAISVWQASVPSQLSEQSLPSSQSIVVPPWQLDTASHLTSQSCPVAQLMADPWQLKTPQLIWQSRPGAQSMVAGLEEAATSMMHRPCALQLSHAAGHSQTVLELAVQSPIAATEGVAPLQAVQLKQATPSVE